MEREMLNARDGEKQREREGGGANKQATSQDKHTFITSPTHVSPSLRLPSKSNDSANHACSTPAPRPLHATLPPSTSTPPRR